MSNNNSNSISKVNGTQACAACKYQRRKCAPDCILAPYFPHDRQRQFLNAHKLFGVSNITKIIRNLDQPDKDEAMKTIIYESDVRASDPVGGCYRLIRDLQCQIDYYKSELDLVYHNLELCRAQSQVQVQVQAPTQTHTDQVNQQQQQLLVVPDLVDDGTVLDCEIINDQINYDDHHHEQFEPILQTNGHVGLHDQVNSWGMQESTSSSMPPVINHQHSDHNNNNDNVNECDDHIKPLLDLPNIGREDFKFDPDDAIDQSRFRFEDEENINVPSKETILVGDKTTFHEEDRAFQHAQHEDLKGDALYFSLTNCSS